MVDALHEAQRILVDGGVLVDARPDSRIPTPVLSAGLKLVGTLATQREAKTDDQLSDRAVREVVRRGWFRSLRHGVLRHRVQFSDARELREYLDEHLRLSRRINWRVPPAKRIGRLIVERPVRFEILERVSL